MTHSLWGSKRRPRRGLTLAVPGRSGIDGLCHIPFKRSRKHAQKNMSSTRLCWVDVIAANIQGRYNMDTSWGRRAALDAPPVMPELARPLDDQHDGSSALGVDRECGQRRKTWHASSDVGDVERKLCDPHLVLTVCGCSSPADSRSRRWSGDAGVGPQGAGSTTGPVCWGSREMAIPCRGAFKSKD
ncbi:hypothetical protein LY78DRAFT_470688 [Colletotrichum sublineola]|nr:hypothetical protein LY78DRAFT_470688 [Colletotrichum sublineola]